jgi:formate dehydrogenase gamma subunit
MKCIIRASILLAVAVLYGVAQTPDNSVCASCHDQAKKLPHSVHASLSCTTCHPGHEDYPHPAGLAKPRCSDCHSKQGDDYSKGVHGQALAGGNQAAPDCSTCHNDAHEVLQPESTAFRKTIPDICGLCHSDIADQYKQSVHGTAIARGEMSAAVCTDCHGEHMILSPKNAASPVFGRNVRNTCGQCHGNRRLAQRFGLPADRLTTFDASYHGLAAAGGSETVANCSSCHGIHNILPSSDPRSMINPKNLPKTCGKCHPGAGTRFAIGPVHLEEAGNKTPAALAWVRSFYLLVIPFTIGVMVLHHAGDWVCKLIRYFRGVPAARVPVTEGEMRMYRFERISHALLAVSFIVLAWSGLALKFPDAIWAKPFQLGASLGVRRNIHRIAAVVMMGVAAMHVYSLIFNRKLRKHWFDLLPKRRDPRDAAQMLAYNLGLRNERPKLPDHSYIEKAEYWAVVWGAIVMVVTGGLLWATNFSLHYLPKLFLDIATSVHWYEAVLATLAILVWHFYSVLFDPDIYPMDTAWLTGKSPRRRDSEDKPESGDESEPESQEAKESPELEETHKA